MIRDDNGSNMVHYHSFGFGIGVEYMWPIAFFPRIAKAEGEDSRFLHDSSNGQDNYSKKTRGGLQVLPN
jgi:hypothetical protein